MKNHLISAINQGYAYADYVQLIKDLLQQNTTTSQDDSEVMVNFSSLNLARMKRLDKTIVVPEAYHAKILAIKTPQIWLVLTEGWCGDAAQLIPVMQKMANLNPLITLKLVLRDQNKVLMDLFLTRGSRSIPKLIAVDQNNFEVLFNWGPRPKAAQQLIDDYKAKHGILDEVAKTDLQKWYTTNKGLSTVEEILALL